MCSKVKTDKGREREKDNSSADVIFQRMKRMNGKKQEEQKQLIMKTGK